MIRQPLPGFARLLAATALMLAQAHAANKIVFLAGGKSHGPGGHEFRAGCMLLAKALNELSQMNLGQLETAVRQISDRCSRMRGHDWRGFLLLDFDLSGLPCGQQAQGG